jgi:hypothetical protein
VDRTGIYGWRHRQESTTLWTNRAGTRRICCGSGPLTLHARFGHKHRLGMFGQLRRWLDRANGVSRLAARRLPNGVARTDTFDLAAARGRHRFSDMWIHRIGCGAEKQATRPRILFSGLLLWIHCGPDLAWKASRPARTRSRRPVRLRSSTNDRDASAEIVAAAVAPPDKPPAPAGIRAITNRHASWNGERIDATPASALALPAGLSNSDLPDQVNSSLPPPPLVRRSTTPVLIPMPIRSAPSNRRRRGGESKQQRSPRRRHHRRGGSGRRTRPARRRRGTC